jgi:hypothetical protein
VSAEGGVEAVDESVGTTACCGEAASIRSAGKPVDCNRDETALESVGLRVASRPRYQKTNAPCKSAKTINSQTIETSTPCGTGIKPMRLDAFCSRTAAFKGNWERGAVCIQRGSLTVVSNVVVPERMPENFPAQPQQYLARSLLGV